MTGLMATRRILTATGRLGPSFHPVLGLGPSSTAAFSTCRCNCLLYNKSGNIFTIRLKYLLAATTQNRTFIAGNSANLSQAPNPVKSDESKSPEEIADISALKRLEEIQSRQKRLLEEPDVTEPHLVYKGPLAPQMKSLKMFSFMTSAMGLMMYPIILEKSGEVPMAANIAAFSMVGFFTIATPFLIQSIARRYVNEMIYDPKSDTYKAATYSFFLQRQETSFKIEDVNVPDVPGPFTSFNVKTKDGKTLPFFTAPEAFIKASHYGRLMGYDKPIDLHLGNKKKGESESKSGNSRS